MKTHRTRRLQCMTLNTVWALFTKFLYFLYFFQKWGYLIHEIEFLFCNSERTSDVIDIQAPTIAPVYIFPCEQAFLENNLRGTEVPTIMYGRPWTFSMCTSHMRSFSRLAWSLLIIFQLSLYFYKCLKHGNSIFLSDNVNLRISWVWLGFLFFHSW